MPRYLDRESDPGLGREEPPRAAARRGRTEDDSGYQFEVGAGSLLAMFCGLAVLCGLFFAFGYTLGKHAVPASFTLGASAASPALSGSQLAALKPNPSTPAPVAAAPPNPAELSAAEQGQTPAGLQAPAAAPTPSAAQPSPAPAGAGHGAQPAATASSAAPAASAPAPAPASAHAAAAAPTNGGAFAVQVFAGVNSADAYGLAAALKARQYPVFVLRPAAGAADGLYRVQVGPYATQQQAEQMRSRLAADGYNAIIKSNP